VTLTAKNAEPSARNEMVGWKLAYVCIVLAVCSFGIYRLVNAWPDSPILSQLWFIQDLDALLSGRYGAVKLVDFGGTHALTGYRWYQYINAKAFGLNGSSEVVAYYLIIAGVALPVGLRILGRISAGSSVVAKLLVFVIPFILGSFVGAGSRGMELGTYFGVAVFVWLLLLCGSSIPYRVFLAVAVTGSVLVVFLFLGGYAIGPTVALATVWLIQKRRPMVDASSARRFAALTFAFVAATAIYGTIMLLVTGLGDAVTAGGQSGGTQRLSEQISASPLFPAEFLLSGEAGGITSVQTFELYENLRVVGRLLIGAAILGLCLLCATGSLRRARGQSVEPLALVLFPFGIIALLLLTRNSTVDFAQSSWYTLHFKLQLVGCVWMGVNYLSNPSTSKAETASDWYRVWHKVGLVTASFLGIMLAVSLVWANRLQIDRQPAEHAYFNEIIAATRSPLPMTTDAGGLTKILLSPDESEAARVILRRHRLSIFSPEQASTTNGSEAPWISEGELFDDGWAGSSFSVQVLTASCPVLRLTFDPGQSWGANRVVVDGPWPRPKSLTLNRRSRIVTVPASVGTRVSARFDRTWVPAQIGQSKDERTLSALVKVSCASS